MNPVESDKIGKVVLMMGNEAIARGAIEAGLDYSASYPGSPSSEIQENLAKTSKRFGHYAQWSVNEKVALESCIGASFAGMRAITSMKQNGINVASDIVMTVNLSGTRGGIVLVVADDPQGHSSTNEMDSRPYVKFADLPMIEPSSAQEAKDMVKWAFDLSEELKSLVIMRSVTRISHARGSVKLGEIPQRTRKPDFGQHDRYLSLPPTFQHIKMHKRIAACKEIFSKSPFNEYIGPKGAKRVIIASGTGVMYGREAYSKLSIEDNGFNPLASEVGFLKIGTTWPLPEKFIADALSGAEEVLVLEEIDPFLEDNIKVLILDLGLGVKKVFGKNSGHVAGALGPAIGEINPDIAAKAISTAWGYKIPPVERITLNESQKGLLGTGMPYRDLAFCPGCPHRASFWATNMAVKLDGRDAIVMGDIGCYSMGAGRTGYFVPRTMHCMGSGIGFANGLGQLGRFGFTKPVLAFCGDSTFFHSCMPSLINAKYNSADLTLIVLDNSATSMTGFQPHPGTGKNALGEDVPPIDIADITRGMGISTHILEPFEVENSARELADIIQEKGVKVVIFRHPCALVEAKKKNEEKPRVVVDSEICIGETCGCSRFGSRVFGCPALIWNAEKGRCEIDEVLCSRCGLCVSMCPKGAIKLDQV